MTAITGFSVEPGRSRAKMGTHLEAVRTQRNRARDRGYLVTIISYDPYQHNVGEPRWFATLPEAMEYEAKVLDLIG